MISIIIPTLNEKDTIIRTIKEIQKNIFPVKHEIIVVDDNSPDKTWQIVQKSKLKNVFCLRRINGKSLSSAVIEGFSKAKYPNLLVMDADGQHDPTIIKQMLKLINNNDFVTGSRFIKGGV
jgi:dolichol-phosphate mannosyltransferase